MQENSAPPAPESAGDAADTVDRRELGRYPAPRNPHIRLLARPSFQAYQAVVRDLSVNGMGLLLDQRFEVGTILAIQLRQAHQGLSCILSGKVTHATRQPDGQWLIGCTLSRSLTDDEVWTLL
jgi:PilZ domain